MVNRIFRRRQLQFKPAEVAIAELIATINQIPRDELPDGPAREALVEAVRVGEVIGVYKPHTFMLYNIELAGVPRDIDPRVSCVDWRAWWDAGKNPTAAHIAERRAAQLQARLELQGGQG